MVEHIITHVLVMLNDDLGGSSADDYLLKVFGFSEYLIKYVFDSALQLSRPGEVCILALVVGVLENSSQGLCTAVQI